MLERNKHTLALVDVLQHSQLMSLLFSIGVKEATAHIRWTGHTASRRIHVAGADWCPSVSEVNALHQSKDGQMAVYLVAYNHGNV